MAAGLMDQVAVLAVFVRQRPEHLRPHDVREAHDGVQRRAQFVGHVGQEPRLAGCQSFSVLAGLLQRGLTIPLRRRIAHDPEDQVFLHAPQGHRGPAVDGPERGKAHFGGAVRRGLAQGLQHRRAVGATQGDGGKAEGLQGVARHAGRRAAKHRPDTAVRIQRHNQVRLFFQQGLETLDLIIEAKFAARALPFDHDQAGAQTKPRGRQRQQPHPERDHAGRRRGRQSGQNRHGRDRRRHQGQGRALGETASAPLRRRGGDRGQTPGRQGSGDSAGENTGDCARRRPERQLQALFPTGLAMTPGQSHRSRQAADEQGRRDGQDRVRINDRQGHEGDADR